MFKYDLTDSLRKKLKVLSKKDKSLAINFKKKLIEIINKDKESINTYKNLKAPLNNCKRIHLTSNFILLFEVDIINNKIIFIEITHRDYAYKK
ncbi:addiction module toxin RelE [Candidatus Woesearchaeota archaeon]|nr:addiction module toxin RelE [Candidatus Woesearchaeota archaeon]